jgi:hypothetical protein
LPKGQTRTVLAVSPGPVGFDIQTLKCPACNYTPQTRDELPIDPNDVT